jgi:hypothetical protein
LLWLTGTDREVVDAARALAEPAPGVEHLFPADIRALALG